MNQAFSTLPHVACRSPFAQQASNAELPSPHRAGTARNALRRGLDVLIMLILLVLMPLGVAHAADLHSASALRAGGKHVCALEDGALFCWGDNAYGQIGDGTSNNTHVVPVEVTGMTGITEVAPGYEHNCVLISGAVKCSGRNNYGQLGDGSTIASGSIAANATPLDVVGVSGATAVASGKNHSCALLAGGTVKCWGQNSDGQLGNNSQTDSSTPVDVSGISGATAIAAGAGHTCAILSGGAMKCWGSNSVGALGTGSTTPTSSLTPVNVTEASGVTAMALAGYHTCVVVAGGDVKCWGWNIRGQLGDGTTTNSATAITVSGVSGATSVAAGYWHSCATVSGGVKCWGGNGNGQLGNGNTTDNSTAQTVLDDVTGSALTDISSVTAGEYYTCALLSTGKAKCWGYNNFAQLGNGYGTFSAYGQKTKAVSVTTPAGAPTAIVATPGNAQISIAFTAPSDLGSPAITNYSATCTSSNGGTPRTIYSVTASPAVVTSLTNGKSYTCTVTAYAMVMGADSVASNSVTPSSNVAPTAGSVALSGTAKIGQLLTGSYAYSDAESDAENSAADGSSYRIVRSTDNSIASTGDNSDVVSNTATGGTNQTYTVATADYGKYLFYCVTPKASTGAASGAESCSSASGPISRDVGAGDPVPNAFGSDTGDGNGDGALDWQQSFVASLPVTNAAASVPAGKRWATLEASPNTLIISNVTNSAAPGSLPRGKTMPLGKFGFSVSGLANGGSTTVSLLVDSSLGMRGYLKQANGQSTWTDISSSTTVFGNKTKITFTITDGGPYDADGVANGTIVDPGGAVLDLLNPVVAENTTYVGEMSAVLALNAGFTGLQGAASYTLTGADAARFSIDASSGKLRFIAAPDYEAPASAASSNVYSLTVTATGATSGTASEAITVTVLNDMGSQNVITDLAGDRTTFTPGSAEFIDNDPTLANVGVFSDPISGYLLISQGSGTADGTFTLDGNTALPGSMAVDASLDGSSGKALKYTLTAATADHVKTVLNNLKYDAASASERSFSVILNNGTNSSEAVTFTMIGNGDGTCGTANGGSVASAPAANLCTSGTATPVTGSGPWSWACVGSGTGANASCSASVAADTTPPTLPAASIVVNNQSDPHQIILTFSEPLNNANIGPANLWAVSANSGTPVYSVASVALSSGNQITLTLNVVDLGGSTTAISNSAANGHLKVTPPATLTDTAGNAYAAGQVSEAGATHVLDNIAPTMSNVAASSPTSSGGSLAVTASEKAKGYWVAVASGATAPTPAQVKAGGNYGAVSVVASGNGILPAGTAGSLSLSGLAAASNYDLYVMVDDAAGNPSATVGTTSLTTTAAPVLPPSGDSGSTGDTTTLPSGGGTVAPTNGQTVVVTDNGGNGSTINLPTPPSGGTSGSATVTVSLPGTGNVAVSNNSTGTQLHVQSVTLPGSSTPVSTVQVSNGSATLVASGAGQTLVTTGISNGLTLTAGASGTSATVTASGNSQSITLTGSANLTLGGSLDTQRTSVTLNQASSGNTPTQANLNIGGQTLSVSPGSGSATVQVVPTTTANGQTTSTLVVASGSANISAQSSGQILNAIPTGSGNCPAGSTGGYFEARSNNAQSNVLSVNQGNLALTGYIPQGVVAYHYTSSTCSGFAMATPLDAGTAKEILIYQGEYVEVDKNGQPTKIVVRSKDGKSGAAGDPVLIPNSTGLIVDTLIPGLSQNSGRLPAGQSIAQSIESLLKLYHASWTVSSQDSFGAVRLSNRSGDQYALLPVGQILADPERPDGIQCYGNGLCQITAHSLTTSFNAALVAPPAFVAELRKIDPAATVRLNQDGNLLVTLNNHSYLAQASWNVVAAEAQGFASGASAITFSSASGSQTLYPVLANLDRLQTILKQIDASATALGDHQGGFTVQSQGQLYRLTPAWELITTPAAHANDDYWLDNGAIYINYLNGTAQGVSVK